MAEDSDSWALRLCTPLRFLPDDPSQGRFILPQNATQPGRVPLSYLIPEQGHESDDKQARPFTTVVRIFEEHDDLTDPEGWAFSPQNINDTLFQMIKISEHLKRRGHSTRTWGNIKIRLRDSTLTTAPLTQLIQAKVHLFQLNTIAELKQIAPHDKIRLAGITSLMKRRRQLGAGREHCEDILRLGITETPPLKFISRELSVRAAEERIERRKVNRSKTCAPNTENAGRPSQAEASFPAAHPPGPSISPQNLPPRQPDDDPYATYLDNTFRAVETFEL